MASLVSREPWWAKRPAEGQTDEDVEWGYLEIYDDGTFRYDPTRPSDQEILTRKSCQIHATQQKNKAS